MIGTLLMQSVGHADHLQSNVMNSCGNSNISTKLRGSKCSEIQEESVSNNRASVLEKGDVSVLSGYNSNDFNTPRGTLVICPRSTNNYSSDHSFSRFKPRYFSSQLSKSIYVFFFFFLSFSLINCLLL